jgi:hypothetical protein
MNSSLLARRVKTEKPMRPVLDFFFFYGSIYTYLSVMRIEKLATAAGLEVRWCPFNLREILIEQDNTAFTRNPARMSYCWRDVQRRAARYGLDFVSRPPYPVDAELLALRVGVIAANEGWCPGYSRATFGNGGSSSRWSTGWRNLSESLVGGSGSFVEPNDESRTGFWRLRVSQFCCAKRIVLGR